MNSDTNNQSQDKGFSTSSSEVDSDQASENSMNKTKHTQCLLEGTGEPCQGRGNLKKIQKKEKLREVSPSSGAAFPLQVCTCNVRLDQKKKFPLKAFSFLFFFIFKIKIKSHFKSKTV